MVKIKKLLTGNHARMRRGANIIWRRIYLDRLHNSSIHANNLASAAGIKRGQARSSKVRRRAVLGKGRREHASDQSQVVQLGCVDAAAVEVDYKVVCAGEFLDQVQLGPGLIPGLESAVPGHNNVGQFRQREAQLVIGLRLVGFVRLWPPRVARRLAGDEADVLRVDEEVDGLLVAAAFVAFANNVAVELEDGRVGGRVGVQVERQVKHLPHLAIGGSPRHPVLSVRDIDYRRGFKAVVAVQFGRYLGVGYPRAATGIIRAVEIESVIVNALVEVE